MEDREQPQLGPAPWRKPTEPGPSEWRGRGGGDAEVESAHASVPLWRLENQPLLDLEMLPMVVSLPMEEPPLDVVALPRRRLTEAEIVARRSTDPAKIARHRSVRAAARGSLGARAAKGVLWTALGNWGNQIATFVVFVTLSRILVPEAFGLIAYASVFVGLVQLIANQGMLDALVQRPSLDREHLDTAFWTGLGVGVAAMALMMGLAYPIGLAVGEPKLPLVIVGLALSIPIGSTNLVQRALMTRDLAFRSITIRTLVATGVGSVAGIAAAVAGLGVWSLVVQNLANVVAGAVTLWALTSWRPRFGFSRSHFHDLFGYGIHVVAFKILNYFSRRGDDFLIGSFLGAASLGLYAIAYRMLTMIIDLTTNLIDSVAFPVYSRLQDEHHRLREAYYRTSGFVALVSFPVFAGILVLSPEIVEVFFGQKWKDSAPVMQVLALAGVVQAVNYLNSTMLKALGKPSWRVVLSGINMILSLIAFFAAVRHGILAVAIALVIVSYVAIPLSYIAVHRLMPFSAARYLARVGGPLVASVGSGLAAYGAREALHGHSSVLVLVLGIGAGALGYAASIALIARPLARDISGLLQSAFRRRERQDPAVGVS